MIVNTIRVDHVFHQIRIFFKLFYYEGFLLPLELNTRRQRGVLKPFEDILEPTHYIIKVDSKISVSGV